MISKLGEYNNMIRLEQKPENLPLVVVYRKNWHAITIQLTKQIMFNSQTFRFKVCETYPEFIESLYESPALVIFHVDMPKESGVSIDHFVTMIASQCKHLHIDTKIAVGIDNVCTRELVKEIKNTDVVGIIPSISYFGVTESLKAISEFLAGKKYWPTIILERKVEKPTCLGIQLTTRQSQVLDLVCHRGLSNKKIAGMLGITESTVKVHISAILKEYGVRNRTQLALAARECLSA